MKYETQLLGSKLEIPPEDNEIEISVFGPGYGESILIHTGNNNWFIVDSCVDPILKEPSPLIYLKRINVDPGLAVKQVIATHWHDDHIRGLSEIVKSCSGAEFICSAAIRVKEFIEIINVYGSRALMESSGVDEFWKILETLQKRAKLLGCRYIPPTFAVANRPLWQNSDCSIYSLSPSDASILATQLEFTRFFPRHREPKRRLIATTPNRTSIVLWIVVGDFIILLGSDLEETSDPKIGWSIIVESTLRPQGKASFFKIPHHGSETAHHSNVWSEMLQTDVVAVLTPYENGSTKLPTISDINRICSLTGHAYSTTVPGKKRTIKRDKTVERTIRETVRNIRQLNSSIGHVRFRIKSPDHWDVGLFGDALALCNSNSAVN